MESEWLWLNNGMRTQQRWLCNYNGRQLLIPEPSRQEEFCCSYRQSCIWKASTSSGSEHIHRTAQFTEKTSLNTVFRKGETALVSVQALLQDSRNNKYLGQMQPEKSTASRQLLMYCCPYEAAGTTCSTEARKAQVDFSKACFYSRFFPSDGSSSQELRRSMGELQ